MICAKARKIVLWGVIFLGACFMVRIPDCWAHTSLTKQLVDVNKELKEDPRNSALLRRKGILHMLLKEWDAALLSFDQADAFAGSDFPSLGLLRAKTLLGKAITRPAQPSLSSSVAPALSDDRDYFREDLVNPERDALLEAALEAVDAYMNADEDHAEDPRAHNVRASILAELQRFEEAVQAHRKVIDQGQADPGPSYYKVQAGWLERLGKLDDAVRILDRGNKQGLCPTLERRAVEIELKRGEHDKAIKRIENLIKQFERNEQFIAQKADVLFGAGKRSQARNFYKRALRAIQDLPPVVQKTEQVQTLEKHIRVRLNR